MHILDLIMYFVTCGIIWFLLDVFSGGDLTEELGGLFGAFLLLIYTVWYIIYFGFLDHDWINIFRNFEVNIKW